MSKKIVSQGISIHCYASIDCHTFSSLKILQTDGNSIRIKRGKNERRRSRYVCTHKTSSVKILSHKFLIPLKLQHHAIMFTSKSFSSRYKFSHKMRKNKRGTKVCTSISSKTWHFCLCINKTNFIQCLIFSHSLHSLLAHFAVFWYETRMDTQYDWNFLYYEMGAKKMNTERKKIT